ncbi:MAG: U32 family peptidase [Lachnospiraceae bacterium]
MNKPELLAPAGDMACFMAAINAGADAIYLGGEEYGARAYASNFSKEELCEALSYAHLFGVKVYLTVNTLVKEREFDRLVSFIKPFYEHGLDGVIVQDLGVLLELKESFPGLELHASTQMGISGSFGAKLLKDFGVCRIVPARELSLDEICDIKQRVGIDIESFIHGAMCYCYSGHCLYSSFLGGRSGNRGRCAGPCRLPFEVFGKKDVYPLSLKDMCTVSILPQLLDSGIDSFKIEGRMKNPYYVAGVTSIYRKYIDLYQENPNSNDTVRVSEKDMELLKKLYLRVDLQEGYYHRHNGREMITIHKPGYHSADEKEFLSIKEKYLDCDRKIKLFAEIRLKIGEKLFITIWDEKGNTTSLCMEEIVLAAQKRPVLKEDVLKQLNKTGNTPFYFETISVIMDDNVFVSLKALGEIRRDVLILFQKQLEDLSNPRIQMQSIQDACIRDKCNFQVITSSDKNDETIHKKKLSDRYRICCQNLEQLLVLLQILPQYPQIAAIEINAFLLRELSDDLIDRLKEIKKHEMDCYLFFPPVFRQKTADWFLPYRNLLASDLFDGFFCNSLDTLSFLRESGLHDNKVLLADYGLYVFNHKAMNFLSQYGISGMVVPYELTYYEWLDIQKKDWDKSTSAFCSEYLVYGYLPFMRAANCIKNTFGKCNHKNEVITIKDRVHKDISVFNQCEVCENTIYNSIPLSLHGETDKIKADYFRISFTIENKSQMIRVLDLFMKKQKDALYEYTKGHFKKGIE